MVIVGAYTNDNWYIFKQYKSQASFAGLYGGLGKDSEIA